MMPRRKYGRIALVAALMTLVAWSAAARREPTPGGQLTISLPPGLARATIDAHVFAPLIEPALVSDARDNLAHPPLAQFPQWRSDIVRGVNASKDFKTWTLTVPPQARVARAVAFCLGTVGPGDPWPATVLRGAQVKVTVESQGDQVIIQSDHPIGPMLPLLSGCPLRGAAATGPYYAAAGGQLRRRDDAPGGPPLMSRIIFSDDPTSAELTAEQLQRVTSTVLLAPYPDVVLLVPRRQTRLSDPFGLSDDAARGLVAFRGELRPDVLAGIYWAGRGGQADGVLPPGLAPPRPLPEPAGPARPLPLSLDFVDDDAPEIRVHLASGDPLLDGVSDRLAVMLRTRGVRLRTTDALTEPQSTDEGFELIRFRAPVGDPALALLYLAGRYPAELGAEIDVRSRRAALLSADEAERLEAAVLVERDWVKSRAVIPVMVADRWFTLDPTLIGVRVRGDGVPLLDRAFWGPVR